jgi:hypothetical protein
MKQQAAELTTRVAFGLLAGTAAWTVLDIIDGQVSTLALAIAVGVGLGVVGVTGQMQRRRRMYNDGQLTPP